MAHRRCQLQKPKGGTVFAVCSQSFGESRGKPPHLAQAVNEALALFAAQRHDALFFTPPVAPEQPLPASANQHTLTHCRAAQWSSDTHTGTYCTPNNH